MAGMVVIVVGGGQMRANLDVTLMGLGSGVTYAVVVLCLRLLRNESSQWLIVQKPSSISLVVFTVNVFVESGCQSGFKSSLNAPVRFRPLLLPSAVTQ